MEIKTADKMGMEAVQDIVKDKSVARRIFALLGSGIKVSEGAIELMIRESVEQAVMRSLLFHPGLKQAGARLDQAALEKLLCEVIKENFKRKFKSRGLTDRSPLDQITRELGLCLELAVQEDAREDTCEELAVTEDGVIDAQFEDEADDLIDFVTIALQDELDASKGALMVVRQERGILSAKGPANIFSLPQVAERLQAGLLEEAEKWGRVLFTLPMIADPDEFEDKIRSLNPAMQAPNIQPQFISQTTIGFGNRPARSRKVIAEVLRDHLNPRLMESIALVCDPEKPEELQTEAINLLIGYLQRLEHSIEITLTAISLVKIMEESNKPRVRQYVFQKLGENIVTIRAKLPNFFQNSRILPMLKGLLLTDTKTFKAPVCQFLRSFNQGQGEQSPVAAAIREDLEITTDPKVVAIYLGLLHEFETDAKCRSQLERQRWELFFTYGNTEAELAEEFLSDVRAAMPSSLSTPLACFNEWEEVKQLRLIAVLDREFELALAHSPKDTKTAKKIALFFAVTIRDCREAVRIQILKTKSTLAGVFEADYNNAFWLPLGSRLIELLADAEFEANFIIAGHVHLANFAALVVGLTNPAAKKQLLTVAEKKVKAIQTGSQSLNEQTDNVREAISLLLSETAGVIQEAKRISEAEKYFHCYISMMRSALLTKALFHQHVLELARAIKDKPRLKPLLINAYSDFSRSRLQSRELAEFLLDIFLQAVRDNSPKPSSSDGKYEQLSDICNDALEGLVALSLSVFLSKGQCQAIIRVFKMHCDKRPQIMTQFRMVDGIGVKPQPVPDPFKEALTVTLARIDPSADPDML